MKNFGMTDNSHRRLRFSLRTLFVVVVVLCGCCAWLGQQLKWNRHREEAVNWILEHGQLDDYDPWDDPAAGRKIRPAPWQVQVVNPFGRDMQWIGIHLSKMKPGEDVDAHMRHLRSLFPEARVELLVEK